jgi:hypothetical protein
MTNPSLTRVQNRWWISSSTSPGRRRRRCWLIHRRMGRAVEAFTPPRPVDTKGPPSSPALAAQRHAQQLGAKQAGDGWPGPRTDNRKGRRLTGAAGWSGC